VEKLFFAFLHALLTFTLAAIFIGLADAFLHILSFQQALLIIILLSALTFLASLGIRL